MKNFTIKLYQLFKRKKTIPNLAKHQRQALDFLRSQQDFIIANCDKNLGPAIIERNKYIQLAFKDHLNDTETYQRLSPEHAGYYSIENNNRLDKWIEKHKMEITKQEYDFITYHFLRIIDPLPYFYLLMKVHKPTLVTRPIVSYPGSTFHALGIWVDTQLQQVAKSFDSYVESSFQLIDELKLLLLPPNALLFLCDANSMYTNIDTTTAINAIEDYLTANQHNFPTLPVTPVIEALEIIMWHNVFQFGDTYWLQKKAPQWGLF